MKLLKYFLVIPLSIFFIQACQKEYSLEDSSGTAEGTLKADGFGDCLPSAVNGIYKIDSTLGADNFIEVQVNFTAAGNYTIVSDTINGYSFKATDNIASPGLYSVRLYGTGKPLNDVVNNFTISFGGSQCDIAVTVVSAATNIGVFTLVGSPGNCSSAEPNGTYTEDIELNSSNTVTITVNVTALGVYTLAAASSNGMFFTGSGTFTTFGPQSVILTGGGTPSSAGTINVTAINLSSTCTFSINVLPGSGSSAAVFTLGGAPGNCTGVLLNGTYQQGLDIITSANTATIDVNVTTIGTYTITTPTINGVSFSAIGSFTTTTNPQTVVLNATGTPNAAGPFSYPVTANANTCSFSVTYTSAAPPAVYTLAGAPGLCMPGTVVGTYIVGTPLGASNTVTINADVTTAGSYSITSNTVNGMTWSATGVFAATGGPQPIVLTATGNTPAAPGTNTFSIGTTSCTFDVIVTGAATDFITCKINGATVFTTFNESAVATFDNTGGAPVLTVSGFTGANNEPNILLGVGKLTGTITAEIFTVNQFAQGKLVAAEYDETATAIYFIQTDATIQTPGFTIEITSINLVAGGRVTGKFSGRMKDNSGAGPGFRDFTEGTFSVLIQ